MNKPAAPKWNTSDLPDLTGRTVIVTGANSGLGFCTTEALAAHGAKVTMAVRDLEKGNLAAGRIRALAPAAQVELARLDLADLTSVRAFAKDWALANPKAWTCSSITPASWPSQSGSPPMASRCKSALTT